MPKKFFFLKLSILILIICSSVAYKRETILPDFNKASYIENPLMLSSARTHYLLQDSGIAVLQIFKTIYQSSRFLLPSVKAKAPKIIHQIWLGSPLPEKYKRLQKLILALHPQWKYKLWDDTSISKLILENQAAYDAAPNYGEKSDIARYEILDRFGGLYLDTDVECLKPFDFLHDRYTFYAALEPLKKHSVTCLSVANAIIGSVPKHPILRECIEQIKNPPLINHTWHPHLQTVIKTGPVLLTRACYKHKDSLKHRGIILPSECFTPHNNKSVNKQESFRFCIHHWANTWMKAPILTK